MEAYSLQNKIVLVTGASSGIGRETALLLSKQCKAIIIAGYKNVDALNDVKAEILANGADCLSFAGNIGDPDFVTQMITTVIAQFGKIDIVINNAARSKVALLSDMTNEEWKDLFATNVDSVFYTSRAVIPSMVSEGEGKIINISSMWGQVGASCEVAYSATKGAIDSFTKALAKELAPSNIQVNAVSFGVIDTPMNACFSKEDMDALKEEIPAYRIGTTAEAAHMILHILESPSYLTGQVIRMDGGMI